MITNKKDYYNRPSKETSYQIAVIAGIGLIILIMGMIVSEVVYDFDNTYIDQFREPKTDTIYQEETMDDEGVLA